MSKCPPASPICTKLVRANPIHYPTTARRRLIATHHDSPCLRTPTRAGPTVPFDCALSRPADSRPSPSVSRPRRGPPARSRNIPLPADHGDQDRLIVADDTALPDTPTTD